QLASGQPRGQGVGGQPGRLDVSAPGDEGGGPRGRGGGGAGQSVRPVTRRRGQERLGGQQRRAERFQALPGRVDLGRLPADQGGGVRGQRGHQFAVDLG